MAVVLDKKDVDKFISLASKENLEATAVAVVTESPRLTMNWRGDTIVDLSREFLNTNGVTQVAKAYIEAPKWEGCYRKVAPAKLKDMPADEAFLENMSRLEVCSQIGLAERFDASIGAATVIMPFGGKNQLTPQEAMAAKIPLEKGETDDATAMRNILKDLKMFLPVGVNLPQHSSVLCRLNSSSDFRQSAVRTVCRVHLRILMFRLHL